MTARPVVLRPLVTELSGRERIELEKAEARTALAECARRAGAVLGDLRKDADDAPLPADGWHWSLSHARGWVAASLDREAVGVDVERVRRPRPDTRDRVLDEREERLFSDPRLAFTLTWTAKEAVLKKARIGLRRLSECRVVAAWSGGAQLVFDGRSHRVHHLDLGDHVAAVSFDARDDEAPLWFGAEVLAP